MTRFAHTQSALVEGTATLTTILSAPPAPPASTTPARAPPPPPPAWTARYTGPLCAVCDENYAGTGSGKTLECNFCTGDATFTIAVYTGGFILVAILLLISYYCCCRDGGPDAAEEAIPSSSGQILASSR